MQPDLPEPPSPGELIKESRWMRTYRHGDGTLYQSKFDWDGIQVSREEVERLWPDLSREEKWEFATAYCCKPTVTAEDEKVLDFLMETGDEGVWSMIASLLVGHSNREKAMSFLLERAASAGPFSANYYQALEIVGDKRAIPVLQKAREIHLRNIEAGARDEIHVYLGCCRALWKLEGSDAYAAEIRKALQSADPVVSAHAKLLLER